MRVTIEGSCLLMRSAGVKTYIWHWLNALRAAADGDEVRTFPFIPVVQELNHAGSVLTHWQTVPRLGLLFGANHSPFLLDALTLRDDIFHTSNLMRQIPRRARLTTTIHDVTARIMPEVHQKGTLIAEQEYADRILPAVAGIIASSENTRRDIIRTVGIPDKKIHVIYPGITREYFDATPTPRAKPYVLYVGTIEPRKNIDRLLDAWQQMRASLRDEFDLLIAGPEGWASAATMARVRAGSYLGYVPEAEMPGLFAGATAFVYPSLYEGFGFPVAQAMAAGTPVVTSTTSCLPEVVGDAGLLADPYSVAEICAALERVLLSESLREDLVARGRIRAREFSWEANAIASWEFFRRVRG
ncbi:MAG: glycosyltransferase family 1 protein [Bryobacteraceae bacterium]